MTDFNLPADIVEYLRGLEAQIGRLATLAHRMIDTDGQGLGIRMDVATLTWPGASTVSDTITVGHTLGRAPFIVLPVIVNAPNPFPVIACFNPTSTQFQARGNYESITPTNTRTDVFRWIAIG